MRRRRAAIVLIVPEMEQLPGRTDDDANDQADALERAFGALTTEQRSVVVLHHYLGLGLMRSRRSSDSYPGQRDHAFTTRWRSCAPRFKPAGGSSPVATASRSITDQPVHDDAIHDWILSGPEVAPADFVDETLRPIPRMRQRRSWRIRLDPTHSARGLAADGRGDRRDRHLASGALGLASGVGRFSGGPSPTPAKPTFRLTDSAFADAGTYATDLRQASTTASTHQTAPGGSSTSAVSRPSTSTCSSDRRRLWEARAGASPPRSVSTTDTSHRPFRPSRRGCSARSQHGKRPGPGRSWRRSAST